MWVVYSPSSGSDLSGANSSSTSAGTVTTVLAASDFQHIDGNEAGQAIIEFIVSAMVAQGQTEFDGFLFCGDYAHHTYGDFAGKEFSFEKADGGWKIKCDKGYVKFTRTNDCAITATFENDGDVFTIGRAEDTFTFSSGSIVLNYNSRGLINGYESNPATFSIYKLEGYTVNVTNGKANKQEAVKGDVVSITADKAPKGKVFNGWVVISGEITISDANSEKTQFTMPDGEVRIVATYADKD